MSERQQTEQLLKRFERSEQAAIESALRRIGRAEARIVETAGKIPASLSRELDSIRARLDDARRSAESRVEEFRAKLIEGPLTEEELRARLVMLEMEYASRVKLAEQGFDLLAERFENHVATGRNWISDVCDQAREAVRIDVKPVRARLGEALVERSRDLAARERELDELRRLRDAASPLEKKIAELEEHGARLKEENAALVERLANVQGDADAMLAQLRERILKFRRVLEEDKERREDFETELKRIEETDDAIGGIIREAYNYREAATRFSARVRALETELEGVRKARFAEESQERMLEEKDAALARLLKEISAQRQGAQRFAARIQALEIELASTKADLKEMRRERRGLIERFNAAVGERDAAAAVSAPVKDDSREMALERKIGELTRALADALAARSAAERDGVSEKTLDIDAEKADLAQRIEGKNREIAGLKSALDAARAQVEEMTGQVEAERRSAKLVQKRLFDADVARDRALAETRAQWAQEQERYEEQLAERTREAAMLRTQAESADRSWQQTLAQQDGTRMQEIFKLRGEIQALKWKLEEKGK
ncbi:MAG: hypothetical protein AUJ52_15195 [Elusimicrobia bacterium CG1_02_63_36]|nr:MAG: hypothetical protein AUJ52_15195 [Elusimicrobia bacterium CG1_02_63_36]